MNSLSNLVAEHNQNYTMNDTKLKQMCTICIKMSIKLNLWMYTHNSHKK